MSTSKLLGYFPIIKQHLDSGFLNHLIISLQILPVRRLISLSDIYTGIGASAYATLDTEQLISHTSAAPVDNIASLPVSDGGVIAASEVHALHTKIQDILDSAVSKWVGNMACILAYLFNSDSRLHNEIWALQLSFLYNIKDTVILVRLAFIV